MRKIVSGLFVSLDGVVESPERWNTPYFNDEIGAELGSQMAAADTMLLGRVTYEEFAAFWADKGSDVPFAEAINGIPKLVASRTLKQQPGKDIVTSGSATLVGSLLHAGLLDELRLLVYPVVVGRGRRLFENGSEQKPLELLASRSRGSGGAVGPAGARQRARAGVCLRPGASALRARRAEGADGTSHRLQRGRRARNARVRSRRRRHACRRRRRVRACPRTVLAQHQRLREPPAAAGRRRPPVGRQRVTALARLPHPPYRGPPDRRPRGCAA